MTNQDMAMFGVSQSDIDKHYIDSITTKLSGIEMTVMSVLSDAQEMLYHGDHERARKQINIAKYILSDMIDKKRGAL